MKRPLTLVVLQLVAVMVFGQAGVGIGVPNPHASAVLHIQPPAAPKGLLIPRLSSDDLNNIDNPAEGLLVYDTTNGELVYYSTYNGVGSWQPVGMPRGSIIMWSGTTPPKGWALCDGGGGRPDLRERFIVGAGGDNTTNPVAGTSGYSIGAVDGLNAVTLTIDQMPSHDHSATTAPHNHSELRFTEFGNTWRGGGDASPGNGTGGSTSTTTGASFVNVTVNPRGGGLAHENRPPFYALAFIIKM